MDLTQALDVRPGVTAIIGGGGKTTLLRLLGRELAERNRTVLLCTTTKFYPFRNLVNLRSPSEEELRQALQVHRLAAAGSPVPGTDKWTAPELSMDRLASLADYVLVEADGSAGHPMKAHAPHEPVIPKEANQTILVLGASGFGRPIAQAAHRPELYAERAGAAADEPVTPERAVAVLLAEGLHHRIYVNQVETAEQRAYAARLGELLPCTVAAGALKSERSRVICW